MTAEAASEASTRLSASPKKSSSVPDERSDVNFVQEDGEVSQQTVEGDVSQVLLTHPSRR